MRQVSNHTLILLAAAVIAVGVSVTDASPQRGGKSGFSRAPSVSKSSSRGSSKSTRSTSTRSSKTGAQYDRSRPTRATKSKGNRSRTQQTSPRPTGKKYGGVTKAVPRTPRHGNGSKGLKSPGRAKTPVTKIPITRNPKRPFPFVPISPRPTKPTGPTVIGPKQPFPNVPISPRPTKPNPPIVIGPKRPFPNMPIIPRPTKPNPPIVIGPKRPFPNMPIIPRSPQPTQPNGPVVSGPIRPLPADRITEKIDIFKEGGVKGIRSDDLAKVRRHAQKCLTIAPACDWWIDLCCSWWWDQCCYPSYWNCWQPCRWNYVICPQRVVVINGTEQVLQQVSYYLGISGSIMPGVGFGIQEVKQNSPGALAGLVAGDVIVLVNGVQMTSEEVLLHAMQESGGVIDLEVLTQASNTQSTVRVVAEQMRTSSF